MVKHRSHSIEFKRQVAQEFLAGETLHGLAKRHDVSRNLVRVWVEKYEAGAFDEDARAADLIQEYEARVAALERLVGKQALELEFLKGALRQGRPPRSAPMSVIIGPGASPSPKDAAMGIARSSFYAESTAATDDTAPVEAIHAIKDEFEAYGWRRTQAALRHQGWLVNHEKIKRLMREHGLNPPLRRRFVATTDSAHDQPIFPDRTRELAVIDGPNQLWVADLTYVAIAVCFVYVAMIMDAWSRRIVGYAIGRRIDARLTLAALDTAIAVRHPPPGCIHHSDRGSQYAAQSYRNRLAGAGLVGSMGRRGNPYDNAMAESLMKTLKVEGVYPMAFETNDDVAEHLPRFIQKYNDRRLHSALGYRSPDQFEEENARPPVKTAA